jgi:hypothetical protein
MTNYELRKKQTISKYYSSRCQRMAVKNTTNSPDSRDLSCAKTPYLPDLAIICLFRV